MGMIGKALSYNRMPTNKIEGMKNLEHCMDANSTGGEYDKKKIDQSYLY